MSTAGEKLFQLLPALYRMKDAQLAQSRVLLTSGEQTQLTALQAVPPASLTTLQQQQLDALLAKAARGPLQSLLMLLGNQLAIVSANLDQLYDDQFIETCAKWVIPYIGDLIGYQSVRGIAPAVASPRAEVAHTISFRRRKGTVLVLEQLARDVTGWGAHAVEMFKVLADTQYMNHIRPHNHYAPNLRRWQPGEYMNTGFDQTAHKIDVRRIAVQRGRYNIQNIAIYLWSLNAYPLTMAKASQVPGNPQCFRFSSLGRDIPLFNNPISQGADITVPAEPQNVPNRLSRHVLCQDIQNSLNPLKPPVVYYGVGKSLALYVGSTLQSNIRVCDLEGSDGAWTNMPVAGDPPAVDPQLGRIALPPGMTGDVNASFYYGFYADMGGGEYPRSATFTASPEQPLLRVPGDYATVHEALLALDGAGVVEITDSGTYPEPGGLTLNVKHGGHVELRAADDCRPTVLLGQEFTISGGAEGSLDINGLVIGYAPPSGGGPLPVALIHVPATATNALVHLGLTHCTLVPGLKLTPTGDPDLAEAGIPTLLVASAGVQVQITRSILGALWIDIDSSAKVTDSIIDATSTSAVAYVASVDSGTQQPSPGGSLTMSGCTVIGKVYASLLSLISECIFWAELSSADTSATPPLWKAPLWAVRRQEGCVRFSYLPEGAIIPRNFKCVEQAEGVPQPLFYSLRYGDPAYCKLLSVTDDVIRRGAEDGGEMGAFHFVLAPLRESDLRVRITEYLPVGLEFGVFYEN